MSSSENLTRQSAPNEDSLFPLPLTSIEKFHWLDHSPDFPNLVFCRIRIDDRLDKELAESAWRTVIARHPLARCKVKQDASGWNWSPENEAQFQWKQFNQTREKQWNWTPPDSAAKVDSYLGIFCWPASAGVSTTQDSSSPSKVETDCNAESVPGWHSEIWFYIHHAIADGVGSCVAINEWMIVYSNLVQGRMPTTGLNRLDPGRLRNRNRLGLLSWSYLKHLWKQPIALFGAAKFVFRRTDRLMPSGKSDNNSNDRVFPAITSQWLTGNIESRLRHQSKLDSVMVNSLLLANLFRTLTVWRTSLGNHHDKDWIRIIVPMSIRQVSDRRLPAANRATVVQIDRQSHELAKGIKDFVKGIDFEIKVIRAWQLDKIFLIAIRALAVSKKRLSAAAKNEKSRAMALFTNLGSPFRKWERFADRNSADSFFPTPTEIDLVGPIKQGTPINLNLFMVGSRMRLSLHYNELIISKSKAEQILVLYCKLLKEELDSDS
ncbi:MAG: hypothetical protein AAF939_09815 [Planctomycetota bacterium]